MGFCAEDRVVVNGRQDNSGADSEFISLVAWLCSMLVVPDAIEADRTASSDDTAKRVSDKFVLLSSRSYRMHTVCNILLMRYDA